MFGLDGVSHINYIYVLFQLTFAAITVALISGAIADRVKLSSWIVFVPVWLTLCYFPIAHNVWGGGWLATQLAKGSTFAQDYAGGTVVHINAGIAGGILALIIGRRVGFMKDPMRPHNLTLTMIGAGLLWFGWYGFNVGSIVFSSDSLADPGAFSAQFQGETGVTFLNTTIATCAAMLGWLLMERILHGKATSLGAASGIVAGLVAITPSCGAVNLVGAIVIGAVAGILCAAAVGLKFRLEAGRLARRRRRPPGRRSRRHPADRLRVDLDGARRHRRPVLRRRVRLARRPDPRGAVHDRVDRRPDHGHRPRDQVHDRLAGRRGGRGRGHRLRPARRVGVRPAHEHQQRGVDRRPRGLGRFHAGAAPKTEGANA